MHYQTPTQDFITLEEAAAATGIRPNELVNHLTLYGESVSRRELEHYATARSARSAMGASSDTYPRPGRAQKGVVHACTSPKSAAHQDEVHELKAKLVALIKRERAARRALFAIDTARSVLMLEGLRRQLERARDPEAVALIARVAFRLRISIGVQS